jgi:uncharacterized RDD family membrane protein YckC
MGLLEKAGQKRDEDKPKAPTKAEAAKPKRARAARKPRAEKPQKQEKPTRERKAREPRQPRTMPEDFELAGRAAKGARGLVDFIVNYAGVGGLLGYTAAGSNFNPTWLLVGALLPILLNMVFLPMKTNRTIGMFLTRTRYVSHKGDHPNWTHLTVSNLTGLLIMGGLAFALMGTSELTGGQGDKDAGTKYLVMGICLLLIPAADYIVTKIRKANGEMQNMWDTIYGCWFVVAQREESDARWMSRLESLGDWGEKKGWSGADEEESEDASD